MNLKKNMIIIGIATLAVAGAAIFLARNQKTKRRLTKISDEGYETAHDILFPMKQQRKYKSPRPEFEM